jgi:hypothetical protein
MAVSLQKRLAGRLLSPTIRLAICTKPFRVGWLARDGLAGTLHMESADNLHTRDQADNLHTRDQAGNLHTRDQAGNLHTRDQAGNLHTRDQAGNLHKMPPVRKTMPNVRLRVQILIGYPLPESSRKPGKPSRDASAAMTVVRPDASNLATVLAAVKARQARRVAASRHDGAVEFRSRRQFSRTS